MKIRAIEDGDVPAVAALLRVLAEQLIVHECTPDAARRFLDENNADGVRAVIAQGHVYHVAVEGEALLGFVAVRQRSHLYHLFVAVDHQRRGLARRLWDVARQAAIQAGGDGNFTVNASNGALAVYEALGFERSAPMQCVRGIYFNPMRLSAAPLAGAA